MMQVQDTKTGDRELLNNYFKSLVNSFYKILPMREKEERSLPIYIDSLQNELIGLKSFIPELGTKPQFLSLLSILEFIRVDSKCDVATVKREVFKAISICNKLKDSYTEE